MPVTRRYLLAGYVAVLMILTLAPVPSVAPDMGAGSDKVAHFILFGGLAAFLRLGSESLRAPTLLVVAIMAGLVEILQSVLPYRTGEWLDFVAGCLGAVVVLGIVRWVIR